MNAKRVKTGFAVLLTTFLGLGTTQRSADAEHFDILLQVDSGGQSVNATADTTPPIGGVNPRPVLKVKSGANLKIKWRMASGFPHGVMKAATVHFFIVKETAIGQKPVPDPAGSGGYINTSVTTDFAPKSVAAGSLSAKAPEAGIYLIRVQSEDTHVEHDHEHFSAVDLVVE